MGSLMDEMTIFVRAWEDDLWEIPAMPINLHSDENEANINSGLGIRAQMMLTMQSQEVLDIQLKNHWGTTHPYMASH